MTGVVDGVRRIRSTGAGVRPDDLGSNSVGVTRPAMKPLNAHTMRANAGVRYMTGLDGMRRPAPAPSPAETITPMPRLAVATASGAITAAPTWALPRLGWAKQALSMALIASLVAVAAFGVKIWDNPAKHLRAVDTSTAKTVIPRKSAPAVAAVTNVGIQNVINQFVQANPGNWGIVATDLSNGATATYQASEQMESASLYKLFVAEHIYQEVDLGKLALTDAAGGGSDRDIEQCLTIMINISDNTCGRALGAILGWGAQNEALAKEGYQQTDLATPQQTSAQDVALLLSRLYSGTLVSPASTASFMQLLKEQTVNNRLPTGLPAGTIIAHKTGDLDGYAHDAGIVYGPQTNYLVVVMSGPWVSPDTAPPLFGQLSASLWHYFEN